MDNIVLIGMPGVGKSTIGVVLAKILGYRFIDTDILIQEQEKKLLHQIIEEKGIDGFLTVENRVNSSLDIDNAVIATGGSVVYEEEAMKHLSRIGTIIYLKVSFEELDKRLSNIRGRGVVLREGQTLKSLYEERTPLYEKYAHMMIDEENKNVEETIAAIQEQLVKQSGLK